MSKLLISEPPLQVLRSLAVKVGLNEAIVLQQVHYLSLRNAGWVEKSIREWHRDDFPFWGIATVKRTFTNLRNLALIVDEKASRGMDHTLRYRVDYDALERLLPSDQIDPIDGIKEDQSSGSKRSDALGQSDPLSNREQSLTAEPPNPPSGGRQRDKDLYEQELDAWIRTNVADLAATDFQRGTVLQAISRIRSAGQPPTAENVRDYCLTVFASRFTDQDPDGSEG